VSVRDLYTRTLAERGYQPDPAQLHATFAMLAIRARRRTTQTEHQADRTRETLLEGAPDAIVVTDESGVITYVNTRARELFGYARDEMLGNSVELLLPAYMELPRVRQMGDPGLQIRGRHKDGREVFDHVYATFEYPGGRAATFSSIESNAFEDHYEMFLGTKGTLILQNETDVFLFNEGESQSTRVEVSRQTSTPVADASATRPADSPGRTVNAANQAQVDRGISYKNEIAEFCAAVRTGGAVRGGGERAMKSAVAVLAANASAEKHVRVELSAQS